MSVMNYLVLWHGTRRAITLLYQHGVMVSDFEHEILHTSSFRILRRLRIAVLRRYRYCGPGYMDKTGQFLCFWTRWRDRVVGLVAERTLPRLEW